MSLSTGAPRSLPIASQASNGDGSILAAAAGRAFVRVTEVHLMLESSVGCDGA